MGKQGKRQNRSIILWLLSGVLLVTAMVVIGGITRLTNSGLSIVEWKVITGTVPPLNAAEWQHAFDQYKQFPEYQKLRQGMQLSEFKQIFWWEYIHRLLGRFIGLVFIVPFLYFLIKKKLTPALTKRLIFILALGAMQGLMGWLMVKSGLQDNPHVSHYRLAMHLGLALLVNSVILWTVFDLVFEKKSKKQGFHPFFAFSSGILAVLFIQIIFGAFVAGLKAGFSYNTFPLMNGEFFPSAISQKLDLTEVFSNGVTVQFIHRWFAIFALGQVCFLWYHIQAKRLSKEIKRAAGLLAFTALAQVALGIATLLFAVPVLLGVLHQIMAFVLFSVAVFVTHRLRYYPKREVEKQAEDVQQLIKPEVSY